MARNLILSLIRFLREVIEPHGVDVPNSVPNSVDAPKPVEAPSLRQEYEAIPRGPGGVRRKRNSVVALAAKHRMTVKELKTAVRRTQ